MALNLLSVIAKDEPSAIAFLQQNNLLRSVPPNCTSCGRPMTLVKTGRGAYNRVFRCPRHKTITVSFRKDSCWQNSQLSFKTIVELLISWSFKTQLNKVAEITGLNVVTIGGWYLTFRDVCSMWLLKNPQQIGGPDVVVEVDDIKMVKSKRKHNEDFEDMWVFGGIEKVSGRGFLKLVKDRSAATLLPIIQRHILPGSSIHTRSDPIYDDIQLSQPDDPYKHFVLGGRSSCVERYWKSCKDQLTPLHGVLYSHLGSYLDESMWRDIHARDGGQAALNSLLLHLAQCCPFQQEQESLQRCHVSGDYVNSGNLTCPENHPETL